MQRRTTSGRIAPDPRRTFPALAVELAQLGCLETKVRHAIIAAFFGCAATQLPAAETYGLSVDETSTAAEFDSAIDRFNAFDPRSPETLDARLRFADFLAKAVSGDCRARVDAARSQLDAARAIPTFDVVLPDGAARAASVEYQIHFARSSCAGAAPGERQDELHAAVEAASRGVELYRDAFDAASMATMQFNLSAAYRDLGDDAAAVAALRAAIAMDRDYGYRDDAEENYPLLLQWDNQPATPDALAAMMHDFPQRSSTLTFAWAASVADVSLQSEYAWVRGDESLRGRANALAQRRVNKRFGGWSVSYQTGHAQYHLERLAAEGSAAASAADGFTILLSHMLVHFQDFDVARNGDFRGMTARGKYGARVRADAAGVIQGLREHDPGAWLPPRVHEATRAALSLGFVAAAVAAEDYELETGTWVGASLDQGVWYDMAIPFSLPVAPGVFIKHEVEFAYTRQVPCTSDSTATDCVELVLRAVPDPDVLKTILDRLAGAWHLPRGQALRAWSSTHIRLVIDPATLMPYSRDTRLHSYWPTGEAGTHRWLALSEKSTLLTTRMAAGNP